ncbi:HNH endonuclease [Aeromicrobium sp. A1-2]|uniref:HNH endonuclease n=1 Tax=Aeromicrobium sp. A1-2 TaxID=2107713 RepID=UPI000E4CF745|nr:HNH endonuclease signature motif containing protein [Aeromicrobium sp. A1-2]AXT85233.1 HNH endonuclease [Aeromicrobium sp. A1-2]
MNPLLTIDAMRTAARALQAGDPREQVRAIQAAQDSLDAAKAECLAAVESSKDYELDGSSTLNAWVRNELRLDAPDAATLVSASGTFAALPAVAAAAAAGQIRTDHVALFSYGLKHIGPEIMASSQDWLLDVACLNPPSKLRTVIRGLREAYFPDDLEDAWVKGQDKQDIQVNPVVGGWHVTGFLDVTAGAKFKKVLDSVSAPRNKDDDRPGSERRCQGFEDLLDSVLNNGLPSDQGFRPHVSVFVDADKFEAAMRQPRTDETAPDADPEPAADPTSKPAELAGYGAISRKALALIACGADVTPFLTRSGVDFSQDSVLNVGRTRYAPTLKQRRAVIARQRGVCAAPGCRHTHLEVHHTIWWSRGGTTDVDLLIGLCVRCHHLIHRELLNVSGNSRDGFAFTNRHAQPLSRRRRRPYSRAA